MSACNLPIRFLSYNIIKLCPSLYATGLILSSSSFFYSPFSLDLLLPTNTLDKYNIASLSVIWCGRKEMLEKGIIDLSLYP